MAGGPPPILSDAKSLGRRCTRSALRVKSEPCGPSFLEVEVDAAINDSEPPCPDSKPTRSKRDIQVRVTPLPNSPSSKRQRLSRGRRSPPPSPSSCTSAEPSEFDSETEALEVLTDGDWWEAYRIGERADGCICVRYVGGSPSEDEWIPRHSVRIRLPQDATRISRGRRLDSPSEPRAMAMSLNTINVHQHTAHHQNSSDITSRAVNANIRDFVIQVIIIHNYHFWLCVGSTC